LLCFHIFLAYRLALSAKLTTRIKGI